MMKERGVDVDHSTLNRWVLRYAPELQKGIRREVCLVEHCFHLGTSAIAETMERLQEELAKNPDLEQDFLKSFKQTTA